MKEFDPPELGASIEGLAGRLIRVPRYTSFQRDPAACFRERREIIEWCTEQGIELRRLDMAAKHKTIRNFPAGDLEWEAFIEGDIQAVIFKTRWG